MDEKLPPPSPEEQEQRREEERVTRRTFLMNVGIALNALVGLAIATPVVAYVLGPVLRRKEYRDWITIGNASDFKPGETKLMTFRNPFSRSVGWRHGECARVCALLRRRGSSRCLRLTARTWVPGAVVFRVAAVHVPLPWRRLLRGWEPRFGAARTRAVYV